MIDLYGSECSRSFEPKDGQSKEADEHSLLG